MVTVNKRVLKTHSINLRLTLCNVVSNANIDEMVTKPTERLYILRVLKQVGIPSGNLLYDTLNSGMLLYHLVSSKQQD